MFVLVKTVRSSRDVAVAASAAGVLFVALVSATPGSPFSPVLPSGAGPSGPFRWLAELVGLDAVHGNALAAVGVAAVALAAGSFLLVLREAWRGNLSPRLVMGLAVAYHVALVFLPLLFSRDVYSYISYGRIAGVHGANPYVATPADFPADPVTPFVGHKWFDTPAVYGPLWTGFSAVLARVIGSVTAMIVTFRLIAIAAGLATAVLAARLARALRPSREAFAAAAVGLNPVVLFQSAGGGHNDLLVALSIAGALAFLLARRELAATAVLTLGTLVKASAGVPLLLLIVVAVARRERGRRVRALGAHVAVAGGLAAAFAAPFLQTQDPTLGMVELAQHEGWLALSRLFRRLLDAVSGDTLGIVARAAFPLILAWAVFAIARSLVRRGPDAGPEAQGAGWAWGLLFLMLLGPVLLPWYATWALPLVWLLPRVPRITLIAASAALTVSQFTSEPTLFETAYDVNVLFGHYVLTPALVGLLVWTILDVRRRVRTGAPLEDEPDRVAAPAHQD